MKELYVVNCCRTAIGSFGGSLKNTPAVDMGAIVVKEALKRANVAPENVDELMFGCILTAAQGQNVARQVSIKAGIPYSVPAYTVGMVCGSGMKSVIEGARSILAGDSDIVVCGGTENMSAAPYAAPDARWGARMGDKKLVDTMIKDGLWDAYNNYHMGTTAENINDIWGITREEQDAFAAASQQKTEAAQAAGRFDDEIVPVMVKVKKEMVPFAKDEYPKAGVTKEGIAKLKGAFPVGPESPNPQVVHTFEVTGAQDAADKGQQRVTAANASGINDGAAAIVLASGEAVEKYGLKPMAKLIGWGQGGVDPKIMGVGPVVASRNAMKKAGVWAVHCPDSNTCIASGIAPVRTMLKEGVKVAMGSDIAGGAKLSMLDVATEAIRVSKLRWLFGGKRDEERFLTVAEAFYLIAGAGQEYFGARPGFGIGDRLHAVVFDDRGMADNPRMNLSERLERIIYLGERQDIKAVYSEGIRRI